MGNKGTDCGIMDTPFAAYAAKGVNYVEGLLCKWVAKGLDEGVFIRV